MSKSSVHRRSFLALQRTLAGDQLDLFGSLDDEAVEEEVAALVPVMADDAPIDAEDLGLAAFAGSTFSAPG